MECPVCINIFNTNLNLPIKLPCSHAICQACVNTLNKINNLKCPLCFRNNFALIDLKKCETIEKIILDKIHSQVRVSSSEVTFLVRNLKGHFLEITTKKTDTVLAVKKKIEEIERLPVNSQWLLSRGKPLINEETLEMAGIGNSEIIYLVVRSFGG